LQITADDAIDVEIPGQKYSFGVVIAAQAAGDLAVLESRGFAEGDAGASGADVAGRG
jgi:hypothetical protein